MSDTSLVTEKPIQQWMILVGAATIKPHQFAEQWQIIHFYSNSIAYPICTQMAIQDFKFNLVTLMAKAD